jgi:serine/threonine-protein kinase
MTAAQLQALLEGTPYRVRGLVARGGMAFVLDATDADGRAVVIKVLRPDLRDEGDLRERMLAEAEVLRGLRHPHVVEVLDFGATAHGRPYLVMERLEGKTLAEELAERGALPPPLALDVARQALAGLEAAHAQAVVHRDVKPGNLFVCGGLDGRRHVKLLDFGIAKLGPRNKFAGMAPKTAPGELLGTPWFMAPEQLVGRAVTPATDVYAMGMVLYQMLAGRHPLEEHRTPLAVWQAQLTAMPAPPSRVATEVPAALDRAVLRAIAKAPADRFASAASFAAELTAPGAAPDARAAHTLVEPEPPPAPRPALLVAVAPAPSRLRYAFIAGAGVVWHAAGALGMANVLLEPELLGAGAPLAAPLAGAELLRHLLFFGAAAALAYLVAHPGVARRWLRAWLGATVTLVVVSLVSGLALAPLHSDYLDRVAPMFAAVALPVAVAFPLFWTAAQALVVLVVRRWRP